MGGLIRKAIHIRLKKALYETALPGDRIKSIVFSGNTTMLYLLFGLDVTGLVINAESPTWPVLLQRR